MALYKSIIAIGFGLTCLLEFLWPLVFHIQGTSINVIWHYIFPLLVVLAWGIPYGLISLTLGLSGFSYLLYWPTEGWSVGVSILHYYLWICVHGYCQKKRQEGDAFYYNIYFVQSLFAIVTAVVYCEIYPFVYLWTSDIGRSNEVFMVIAGKTIVNQFFCLAIGDVLLLFPVVRNFMGLTSSGIHRYNGRIVVGAILLAMLFFTLTVGLNNILIDGNFSLDWLLKPGEKVRMTLLLYVTFGMIIGGCVARLFQSNLKVMDLLRESEERFRFAVEASENIIFDLTIEKGKYQDSSIIWEGSKLPWLATAHGSREKFIHPDDRGRRLKAFQDHLAGRAPLYEVEYRVKTSGQEWRWVLVRGKVMRDKLSNPIRMIGELVDITGIKNATIELEKCVAKRTQELCFAMDELEAFTFVVAHDLKSPLRAIAGYGRFIQEDYGAGLDREGNKMVEYIRSIAGDMILLVDKLLEYSTTAQMTVVWEKVPMGELFLEVFQRVEIGYPEQRANLKVAEGLPICHGDPVLLRQMVQNLLVNAFKFSKGRLETQIGITYQQVGREHVFSVMDNGVGFDMEYVGKLYGIFQRLHTAEEFQGFGIGLATVRKIIEKHRGRSWIEGRLGEGTTVFFTLPLEVAPNSSGGEIPV